MKICIVYGTRPEAIKMAPLIRALPQAIVINTGQHAELTKEIRDIFQFRDHHNLNLMKPHQQINDLAARCMMGVGDLLTLEKPDLVLVHGDTTTAMSAALAAFHCKIKIGHVEAGLRTYNLDSPFPEEANRVIIDQLCDLAFCPTNDNYANVRTSKKYVVGNTGIDALMQASKQILPFSPCDSDYVLVTSHRRENHGEPLNNICQALKELSSYIKVIYPAHPHPTVQAAVASLRGQSNIHIIEPLDYLGMIRYMKYARLILTDSGGIQEEAPSLQVPVLCLRNTTERQEAVAAGAVALVGTHKDRIVQEALALLADEVKYKSMQVTTNPYGNGDSASQIVNILLQEGCVDE